MSNQQLFTDREWQVVQYLPLNVGLLVAASDEDVDEKESFTIGYCLGDTRWTSDPLATEVCRSIVMNLGATWAAFVESPLNALAGPDGMIEGVQALERRLSQTDAMGFKMALMRLAFQVARASGGEGAAAVSDDEMEGMGAIVELLGLTPADLRSL